MGLFSFGLKSGDEVISLTGKSLDDVGGLMGKQVSLKGNLQMGSNWRLKNNLGKIVTGSDGKPIKYISEVPEGSKLVKLSDARNVTATKHISLIQNGSAFPSIKTSSRLAGVAVIGYGAWQLISIIGSISTPIEDAIDNFFGSNCEEVDIECQEKSARNMTYLGLGVIGVGAISLLSLFSGNKKSSKE